jgi:hypothetical protein
VLGTAAAPVALAEEYVFRPLTNIPFVVHNAGLGVGEHAARATVLAQQGKLAETFVEGLMAVRDFATGFVTAASVLEPLAGRRIGTTAAKAAVGAETAIARTFTSSDPLVADLANKIEAAYPGHVVGVNVPIRNAAGQIVTDADILLNNAVIQVKSGGGKGLTSQVLRTEQASGLPTIGFGPTLKPSVIKSIQRAGGLVTKDEALLIKLVAP